MPQVGTSSPGQLGQWAGADLLGATQAQGQYAQNAYNANQAAGSGLMGGLMGIGGQFAGSKAGSAALAGMFSDPRMKENVIKIGNLDNGLNLYRFEYKPEFKDIAGHGQHIGVMADEAEKVMPQAVMQHQNGYKMVNYGVIYG